MKFAFPISKTQKLEDGRLLIEGVATSEALDLQGEILDYEGSKRAFEKWAGNIREAHDPKKPVGKAIEVIPDDGGKTISVRAFISAGAKDTQAKVEDGTLSMFSVGGGVPTKTKMEKVGGKPIRRVLEWPMTELSLVDVGANPDAFVSVAKAIGADEEEKPEEPPAEKPAEKPEPEAEEPEKDEPDPGMKSEAPQLTEAQMVELVTKVTDAVLAAIEAKEKAKAEQPPEPPKPAEKSAPEPEIKKTDEMAPADIRTGLDALCILESLLSVESYEVTEGMPEPPEQVRLLKEAIAAVKAFVASEASELLEAAPEAMKSARPIIIKVERPVDLTPLIERLDSINKSAPAPDPRLDALAGIESLPANIASELSKTASDLKAAFSGEVKALREGDVARLAKGMEQILSMPVPGRAPLRNMTAAAQLVEKAALTAIDKANVLRVAAQGAPAQVRDYLLHEAVAIERS